MSTPDLSPLHHFAPGQRWVSDSEPELGLGLVSEVGERILVLRFPACHEQRQYARRDPPLSRVLFTPGDQVRASAGWTLRIQAVEQHQGLACYRGLREDGGAAELPETELAHDLRLDRPADRLLGGRFDGSQWFELRYRSHLLRHRLARSDLRGLTGGRTSLIPHQLYIAHEVGRRHAPRVLLADEVGLGKTIEAGMILHQQLLSGRARRVLILVPEHLPHQWLVEMLRRFNLRFSLFDAERCQAIEQSQESANPFYAEQLVLCGLDFLSQDGRRQTQAAHGDWDLLVVDEAHHLEWSEQAPSRQYQCVERLAAATRGVLLLTATPEQLGKEGHFARLRLLDPDRFPSYAAWLAEERDYAPIARTLRQVQAGVPLDAEVRALLAATLEEEDNRPLLAALLDDNLDPEPKEAAGTALLDHLLDRHGTGRVLFRNTRAAIPGFPRRLPRLYPLPLPAAYAEALTGRGDFDAERLPLPERWPEPETGQPWTADDPRIDWLIALLERLAPAKAVLIAHRDATVLDLAEVLRRRAGLHAALFHRGLSLVERDRAAAFFAQQQQGSRLLLCSEIGSEGRNFQFAHHLVLFDLPLDPNLLEQRIGRLDRIGQQADIHIHIPVLEDSPQHGLARWYQEGLDAFAHGCPAAQAVYSALGEELLETLRSKGDALPGLLERTRILHRDLQQALQQGRDPLLEYQSCRPGLARALADRAAQEQNEHGLWDYLEQLFDCYDIDSEPLFEHGYRLSFGPATPEGLFPGLGDEGLRCTSQRATALSHEGLLYLSWEHPLVTGAMEASVSTETGNSALCGIIDSGLPPGRLLLECVFLLRCRPDGRLHLNRYLPPTPLRLLLDQQGRSLAGRLGSDQIRAQRRPVNREAAGRLVKAYRAEIQDLLRQAEQALRRQVPRLIEQAQGQAAQTLGSEIDRLRALRLHNPNVREQEIVYLEQEYQQVRQAIDQADLQLDAMRLLVTL